MKKLFLLTGLLTLLFVSCSKEEKAVVTELNGNGEKLVFQAVIGDIVDTKTAVQSDGRNIFWIPGDAINLFYGSLASERFVSSITETAASSPFEGTIGVVTGVNESTGVARNFWAVYPYNSANTCDDTGVTLTIPGSQSGVAGTFANNLNPTIAKSSGLDLVFWNVGSWFAFTVSRNDIVRATFSGNNDENVAGTVKVSMDANSRPVVTEVTNGIKSITMMPEGGGCFTPGQIYYMVVLPQTLSNGYSLTLTTRSGESATYSLADSRTFARAILFGKQNADSGLSFLHESVDLGLSVNWATFNVGATSPEEYGDYYAWGETEPYYEVGYAQESPQAHWKDGYSAGYDWSNYKWCNGSSHTLTKYNNGDTYGTVEDYKTVLDPEDDVAHVKWGGSWRIPTKAEQDELLNNCTWTWYDGGNTEFNGVEGYKVTSNKSGYTDRFIFLPAAAVRGGTDRLGAGVSGQYWSSSLDIISPSIVKCLFFNSGIHYTDGNERCVGQSVRPVCP